MTRRSLSPGRPALSLAVLAALGLLFAGSARAEAPSQSGRAGASAAEDAGSLSASAWSLPRSAPIATLPGGLRLLASRGGRTLDLLAPGGWRAPETDGDADGGVGLVWRRSNVSALAGYVEPSPIRSVDVYDRGEKSRQGLFGLSFALHYR